MSPFRAALHLLEQKTATHKFALGQALQFSPALGEDNCKKGRYKVVRQLPETGNMLQYRIKSEMDGVTLAKGQSRGNREAKKPKSAKTKPVIAASTVPAPPPRDRLGQPEKP